MLMQRRAHHELCVRCDALVGTALHWYAWLTLRRVDRAFAHPTAGRIPYGLTPGVSIGMPRARHIR
jgi:hypothetical protein